jgi:hypothetical protein
MLVPLIRNPFPLPATDEACFVDLSKQYYLCYGAGKGAHFYLYNAV